MKDKQWNDVFSLQTNPSNFNSQDFCYGYFTLGPYQSSI